MLGAQPKYIQRALHHFLPGFNERQLNRPRVRLRKLALVGAMHVYKEYLRGMCRWARDEGHICMHVPTMPSLTLRVPEVLMCAVQVVTKGAGTTREGQR
jgi:hypothetical protein